MQLLSAALQAAPRAPRRTAQQQETSLEVTSHPSLTPQSPVYPLAPPQAFLHTLNAFRGGQALLELMQRVQSWPQVNHPAPQQQRPPEFTPMGLGLQNSAAHLHHYRHPSHFQPQKTMAQITDPFATLPCFSWRVSHQPRSLPSDF